MFYLGVDGGGTKTKFTVINESEELIYTIEKDTCHYNQVGFSGFENVIEEGLEEVLSYLSIDKLDIAGVCLGLAGYGKIQEDKEKIEKIVANIFKNIPYELLNDIQIAYIGALGLRDGIVIIAGTGSIAYSINNGDNRRVGGWGYGIGDEGSAYWIGRKLVQQFSKQADGRVSKTKLYYLLKDKLSLKDDYQLIKYIYNDIKLDREKIAELAIVCYIAAKDGDLEAIKIFKEAGKELANLINTLDKDFDEKKKIKVSYVGGVFNCGDLIINPIKENLNENIEFLKPKYTPDLGACFIAKNLIKEGE